MLLFLADVDYNSSLFDGYSIASILEKVKDDIKTNCLILHIDEFQRNPDLIKRLLKECKKVYHTKLDIFVFPILTGLTTIGMELTTIGMELSPTDITVERINLCGM